LQKLFLTSVTVLKAERGMANSIGMSSKDRCETSVNLHGFLHILFLVLIVSQLTKGQYFHAKMRRREGAFFAPSHDTKLLLLIKRETLYTGFDCELARITEGFRRR
jgi:hypothetical protein